MQGNLKQQAFAPEELETAGLGAEELEAPGLGAEELKAGGLALGSLKLQALAPRISRLPGEGTGPRVLEGRRQENRQ